MISLVAILTVILAPRIGVTMVFKNGDRSTWWLNNFKNYFASSDPHPGISSHIFWHIFLTFYLTFYLTSILIFYLAYLPAFYLVYILAFYLAYILAFYVAFFLAYILAFYVAYILAVYLAYILAFHLAAEVQRCPLGSEGPRLRSSGAHWARKVPGWGPAVPTALRTLRLRTWEIGEELARRKWTWKWRQRWWRRRRRTRRRWRRRRRRSRNSCDKI